MHEKPRLGRLIVYNRIGENLSTPKGSEAQRGMPSGYSKPSRPAFNCLTNIYMYICTYGAYTTYKYIQSLYRFTKNTLSLSLSLSHTSLVLVLAIQARRGAGVFA